MNIRWFAICILGVVVFPGVSNGQSCSVSVCQAPLPPALAAASTCCQTAQQKTTDGCSVPLSVLNIMRADLALVSNDAYLASLGGSPNNPAGGVNTAFSNFNGSNQTAASGPCDFHDYCYGSCWTTDTGNSYSGHKQSCDNKLQEAMTTVCNTATTLGQDTPAALLGCYFFASSYGALGTFPASLVSDAAYSSAQTQACLCCGPPPPDNSGCWTWSTTIPGNPLLGNLLTGYVWTCPGQPPAGGGAPPQSGSGCWQWYGIEAAWVYSACGGNGGPGGPVGGGGFPIQIITSGDPNDKVGSPGVGASHYVSGSPRITYQVSFLNDPTASAPAQTVTVADPLNGAALDLSTVALGMINFGTTVLTPTPVPLATLGTYTAAVDLRPASQLIVGITAALNSASGVLTWTFTSLDPTTGQTTTNPLAGFLPPGTGGSVSFSALPKQIVAPGTQVSNQATVIFDVNAPISTPIWTNTIDNSAPASTVLALPATESCPDFRVSWSGSDVGSGIQGFTVYYSDNGGPFAAWLSNVTAATGTFTGVAGHSYGFYSIAQDLVGNVQPGKTVADATTQVAATTSCGPPSLSAQMLNVAQSGTTVTTNLQLTNSGFTAAQTININQITLRTLSGSGTVTLSSPALPLAVGSLAIGATTTTPLAFSVPSTVARFSVTEGGTIQDASGNGYSFSMAQTVIP